MNKKGVILLISFLSFFLGCEKNEVRVIQQEQDTQIAGKKESASDQEFRQPVYSAVAGAKSNPFLKEEEEQAFSETGNRQPIDYLELSAVLYSSSKSKAVINGKILEQGNIIEDKEIIEIRPEEVILKDYEGEYILSLKKVAE